MLVAVKKNRGYLLASDTRVFNSEDIMYDDSSLVSNDRVFPACDNYECVIAMDGDYRYIDYVRFCPDLVPPKGKPLTMDFMINKFIPKLYNSLLKMYYIEEKKFLRMDFKLIVARKSKAFLVENGYVMELGNEETVGKASEMSVAILNDNKGKDPLVRVMECFDEVSKCSSIIGRNVIVSDTSKKEVSYTLYDSDDINRVVNGTFVSSEC